MTTWLLALLLWVVCGLGAAWLAERGGRDPRVWFWCGFLAGPVGLAVVALLQPTDVRKPIGGRHW